MMSAVSKEISQLSGTNKWQCARTTAIIKVLLSCKNTQGVQSTSEPSNRKHGKNWQGIWSRKKFLEIRFEEVGTFLQPRMRHLGVYILSEWREYQWDSHPVLFCSYSPCVFVVFLFPVSGLVCLHHLHRELFVANKSLDCFTTALCLHLGPYRRLLCLFNQTHLLRKK